MKWLKRIAIPVAILLLVLAATAWWLLGTGAGRRFALARVQAATHGALQWQQAQGPLLGPLRIDGLRYDDGRGMRIEVAHGRLDLRFWPLLAGRVHVRTLDLDDVRVTLPRRTDRATPDRGISLKPPIDLLLDHARVVALHVHQDGQLLFAADRIDLAGRWTQAGLAIDTLALRAPDGQLDLAGRLDLTRHPRGNGKADFGWRLGGVRYVGQLGLRSDGTRAQLDLTLRQPTIATLQLQLAQSHRADWQAALHVPPFDPAPLTDSRVPAPLGLQLRGHGDRHGGELAGSLDIGPHHLQLQPLRARLAPGNHALTLEQLTLLLPQAKGRLDAAGTLRWQDTLAWQLAIKATRFDPGELFRGWNGSLDLDLDSHGQLAGSRADATLMLKRLAGQLRGRALHGSGTLHLSPAMELDGQLRLASGASTLQLDARPGRGNDADLRLSIASLGDWLPAASGRLDGQFNLRGLPPGLAINGHLTGRALAWQGQRARTLRLIVGIPDSRRPAGKLEFDLGGARLEGLDFSRLHLLAEGSERHHQLSLDARGSQLSARLALHGALQGDTWNGTLSMLSLVPQGLPGWHLRQPSQLRWRSGAVSLSETCLDAGEPRLCLRAKRDPVGNLEAAYRLHALPLAWLQDAAGASDLPVRVAGELAGEGALRRSASGTLDGTASLRSAQGSLRFPRHGELPPVHYRQLALDATLARDRQHVSLHAVLDQGGVLDGRLALTGKVSALDGQLTLRLHDLAFVEAFDSALANVRGEAAAGLHVGGTLAQPALSGSASLADFAAEVPAIGLRLDHGQLTASAADTHALHLDGRVRSGAGTLAVTGDVGLDAQAITRLALRGQRLTASDLPAARLVVSPDLQLVHDAEGIRLTGALQLDSADVNLDRLPGAGAAKASPDVVVVDRAPPAAATALPISATVKVNLGQHTQMTGMGLDGRLSGELTVNERPGQAATGQGQIRVDGSYRAYGQTLAIEHGLLLFAGTPLDNPGLSMRAVRRLAPNATVDDGQQVGLQVGGTARHPVLTLFSNPPMEQSDALAYLITGKPLSQVSSGEGDMLGRAAQALGSAAGNYLAKSIGSHLGLDDIGVASNAALGGSSAFTVGKYLSPRLYLSYGVGLFEPGEVVTLRYRLSHRWNFEAQSATTFNRASFNYRLEK